MLAKRTRHLRFSDPQLWEQLSLDEQACYERGWCDALMAQTEHTTETAKVLQREVSKSSDRILEMSRTAV